MTRGFYISMLVAALLGVSCLALASQSTFLFKHPKTQGVRVVIGENGGAVVDPDYQHRRGEVARCSQAAASAGSGKNL